MEGLVKELLRYGYYRECARNRQKKPGSKMLKTELAARTQFGNDSV